MATQSNIVVNQLVVVGQQAEKASRASKCRTFFQGETERQNEARAERYGEYGALLAIAKTQQTVLDAN